MSTQPRTQSQDWHKPDLSDLAAYAQFHFGLSPQKLPELPPDWRTPFARGDKITGG